MGDLSLTPNQAAREGLALNQDGVRRTAFQLLSYPSVSFDDLCRVWPQLAATPAWLQDRIESDAKYAVYLDRQGADLEAYRADEGLTLAHIDYAALPGLSRELQQKLTAARPGSLARASRIEGMTPAALTLLAAHARRARPAA